MKEGFVTFLANQRFVEPPVVPFATSLKASIETLYRKFLFGSVPVYDLKETIKCVRVARKILGQDSMKPYAGKEIGPGESATDDEQITEYIRSKAETAYHPSCTLKMGVDKMAVVDEKLKVHGLENLRVADASVMPEITSGNLNAPTLMIGERAADFILN